MFFQHGKSLALAAIFFSAIVIGQNFKILQLYRLTLSRQAMKPEGKKRR
jgi:hypothetical protein